MRNNTALYSDEIIIKYYHVYFIPTIVAYEYFYYFSLILLLEYIICYTLYRVYCIIVLNCIRLPYILHNVFAWNKIYTYVIVYNYIYQSRLLFLYRILIRRDTNFLFKFSKCVLLLVHDFETICKYFYIKIQNIIIEIMATKY